MAKKVRERALDTRSARDKLKVSGKPYYRSIGPDLHLGYRKGKDDELKQMTRFTMEKAKLSGPQEMGPLNPYSRRLVHLTVAEDPEMSSESIGDAILKTVIISRRR